METILSHALHLILYIPNYQYYIMVWRAGAYFNNCGFELMIESVYIYMMMRW